VSTRSLRRVSWAVAATLGALLTCGSGARAQAADEPDPCASAAGSSEIASCWTREAQRADERLRGAYAAALARLPPRSTEGLRRAQKAWLEFREAEVAALSSIPEAKAGYDWERSICAAIARRQLTLERARALERLAQRTLDDACPL
jgi:uncharacterized protein YecT (DUF1311 family)